MTNGTRRGWGVSVMPRPLFTPGKDPVPIVQEDVWAPGPVWTVAENLAPTGIRSPDRPARSQSLYRLSYPAHSLLWRSYLFYDAESFKKFPAFYGTRRFITAFTCAATCRCSESNQFSPCIRPTSWISVLILSSHLRLGFLSGLVPSGLHTETLYTPLPSTIHATCTAHSILLDLNGWIIFGEQCGSFKLLIMLFSPLPCYLVPLGSTYLS